MRAVVTGGAGFIGSHLVRRLNKEGWDVLVLDNLSSGHRENVPHRTRFLWADLTASDIEKILPNEAFDVIFHLASHVGQESSFTRPEFDLKSNIFPTLSLINWAMEHNVKQIVFASSVNVYGTQEEMPLTELNPIDLPSPYAVGKFSSEALLKIYANFGLKSTVLRLFNVYGPGQDMDNILQGMVSIYMSYVVKNLPVCVRGSLDRFRDFVFVTDVVDAFLRSVSSIASGKVYNVCSGRKVIVRDLIDQIITANGYDPRSYPIELGPATRQDQFGYYGDNSLIMRDLGWRPNISLKDGLSIMCEDFNRRLNKVVS